MGDAGGVLIEQLEPFGRHGPLDRRDTAANDPAPEPSDRDLLQSASDARGALAMVMRRHSPVLYAIAFRRLQSAADAEEAVQDAFLLLWTKRLRVHFVGDSALPWLIVSVQHLAANRRRSLLRRAGHEVSGIEPERVRSSDAAADSSAGDGLIADAFARLSPVDAEIATLCLIDGVTYAEAAAHMGLSEGSIRNRLSRARTRLRRELRSDLRRDLSRDARGQEE